MSSQANILSVWQQKCWRGLGFFVRNDIVAQMTRKEELVHRWHRASSIWCVPDAAQMWGSQHGKGHEKYWLSIFFSVQSFPNRYFIKPLVVRLLLGKTLLKRTPVAFVSHLTPSAEDLVKSMKSWHCESVGAVGLNLGCNWPSTTKR